MSGVVSPVFPSLLDAKRKANDNHFFIHELNDRKVVVTASQ